MEWADFLQVLVQGLLIGATYGLLALGAGLVFGVSGLVNFAHGDFVSLAMFVCLALYGSLGLDPYLSLVITFPLLVTIGGLLYWYLIRPIAGHHLLMIVQLTLGISFVLQSGILMSFGGQPLRVPSAIESELLIVGDVVMRVPQIIAAIVSFILAGSLYAMLRWTDPGRCIRAVNQNAHAAALMGINVQRVRLWTFALGMGLVAIAASLLAPGAVVQPDQGFRYTVITLLAMVLGGMTNFVAIMAGGIVLALAESFGATYLANTLGLVLPYAIFVIVMIVRPQGLVWRNA